MLPLAFTISPELKNTLEKIDEFRIKIALSLIPSKTELRLAWEAQTTRIYYSFLLSHHQITKQEVAGILQKNGRKQPNEIERAVFNHKQAMDTLLYDWSGEKEKPVTSRTILSLAETLFTGFRVGHAVNTYRVTDAGVKNLLEYLQAQHDHPVIQAGIVYSQFILLTPFGERSEWVARILAYLFLYKFGFEARKLLVLERYWYMTAPEYSHAFATIKKEENSNAWLHYFATAVMHQFEAISEELDKKTPENEATRAMQYLTDRQKTILSILDNPNERISNKTVQKMCKVSQITASRDLARLSALSLIFPHGKGRSVYYTKA